GGKAVSAENCAPCHGAGGQGGPGYPTLADDSWLWGGTLADIEHTIRVGVRSSPAETRAAETAEFGADQALTPRPLLRACGAPRWRTSSTPSAWASAPAMRRRACRRCRSSAPTRCCPRSR